MLYLFYYTECPISTTSFNALRHCRVTFKIIIPHVKFQQSDRSIDRATILNVTRQRLTAVKFVVEKWDIRYNKINITFFTG